MKEEIRAFDRKIGRSVDRFPRIVKPLMDLFTLVGQPPFTVGIAAAVWGYGWALGKSFYMLAGMVAIVTIAAATLLKIFLHRSRPVNEYVAKMLIKTYSFPSGHAAGAVVSFGLAALVISFRWPDLIILAWSVAVISAFLVGLSRIYLGAHYASDVIGGYIVGLVGLIAILLIEK